MAFMQLANMSLKEQFEQIESLRKQKKLSVDSLCFSSKVHQSTYYAYTKLLADGYIELKGKNYLILRGTHKPTPFPYEGAWTNHLGNFDYINVIVDFYIKLIKKDAKGIFNVGTEFKSMHRLAQRTNPNVKPILNNDIRVPLDVSMNVSKLNKFIHED